MWAGNVNFHGNAGTAFSVAAGLRELAYVSQGKLALIPLFSSHVLQDNTFQHSHMLLNHNKSSSLRGLCVLGTSDSSVTLKAKAPTPKIEEKGALNCMVQPRSIIKLSQSPGH